MSDAPQRRTTHIGDRVAHLNCPGDAECEFINKPGTVVDIILPGPDRGSVPYALVKFDNWETSYEVMLGQLELIE